MAALYHRDTLRLFPTLVGTFAIDAPAQLAALAREVLARADTAATRADGAAWRSANDLLSWSPATRAIGDWIGEAVTTLVPDDGDASDAGVYLTAWATVVRAGEHVAPHAHADAAWTGALYLDAGDSDDRHGGRLALRDPRAGAGMVESATSRFAAACTAHHTPRTGELVVFPAWVLHWVEPYQGARPRISVGFGAR